MNKYRLKNTDFVFIMFFAVITIAGCSNQNNFASEFNENIEVEIISFESDKASYGSSEEINFNAKIVSYSDINNIKLEIKGIKPYNTNYIDVAEVHNLVKGENDITLSAKTPYCTSGCGGVRPGAYKINLEVFSEDELIANETLAIELTN